MISTRSRPEISSPSTVNNGAVSRMIHVSENSRPIRITIASAEPYRAGLALLLRRQFACEDGDENDVVDAEDDLQHSQCEESDPCFGAGNPIHLSQGRR